MNEDRVYSIHFEQGHASTLLNFFCATVQLQYLCRHLLWISSNALS